MKGYVGLNGATSPTDKLFACPSDVFYWDYADGSWQCVFESVHAQSAWDYSSYVFNAGNLFANSPAAPLPGIAGLQCDSIRHPTRTIMIAEMPTDFPYSWHNPKRMPRGETPYFNDAKNTVGFVDGHVSYIKIYRDDLEACCYNPPAGYDYQWSGN